MSMQNADEPVNMVVEHEVPTQHDEEFKKIVAQLSHAMEQYPGFLGKNIFHVKRSDKILYTVLIRFDSLENLRAWQESPIRADLRKRIYGLTEQQPKYHYLSGLETWFALGVDKPIVPPPRYKMALLTWVCVYTLLIIISYFFGHYLNRLVMPLRTLIVSLTLVLLLTYLIMPNVTRLFRKWLYPNNPL